MISSPSPTTRTAQARRAPSPRTRGQALLRNVPLSRGRTAIVTAGLALLLPLTLTGCGRGVHWQGLTYQDARRTAVREDKLIFVYFRGWWSADCTQFEDKVLKDPEVLAETDALVNVRLDYFADRKLANQWRITRVPAFVIVTPEGQVLAQREAPITRGELLEAIRFARAAYSGGQVRMPTSSPP